MDGSVLGIVVISAEFIVVIVGFIVIGLLEVVSCEIDDGKNGDDDDDVCNDDENVGIIGSVTFSTVFLYFYKFIV